VGAWRGGTFVEKPQVSKRATTDKGGMTSQHWIVLSMLLAFRNLPHSFTPLLYTSTQHPCTYVTACDLLYIPHICTRCDKCWVRRTGYEARSDSPRKSMTYKTTKSASLPAQTRYLMCPSFHLSRSPPFPQHRSSTVASGGRYERMRTLFTQLLKLRM